MNTAEIESILHKLFRKNAKVRGGTRQVYDLLASVSLLQDTAVDDK